MKLSERVQRAHEGANDVIDLTVDHPRRTGQDDPISEFKHRVQEQLHHRLGPDRLSSARSDRELRKAVAEELDHLIEEEGAPLSKAERERIAADITEDILGHGPIQRFLDDPTITEIMVNATESIYIERDGRLELTTSRFLSESHLRRVIDRVVAAVGRRIDEASPMVDARLADGSRVNAIIPPLAVDGPSLTVRKFSRDPYGVEDLIAFGTLTEQTVDLLRACVEGRLNILISGGTGTGKTTLLNVLSSFIPPDQRIVTIEDAVELQLHQDHVVRLESRPPNIEGRGQVTVRDLVRNALRMRPDRIVVGEVRGAEALDMLQAMNTGHEGSLSTLHANTPRDALSRLETMVLMAGLEIPVSAIREYISSALHLVVHVSRMRDGSRRVTRMTEIAGMEGAVITLQDIFRFEHAGVGSADTPGRLLPTGIRPKFSTKLAEAGLELPAVTFEPPAVARR